MIIALVTDRRRVSASSCLEESLRCLNEQARYAADAGIDFVQVREPDLPAATLVTVVSRMVAVTRGTATRVLVNDRLDVALAAGAHGVHLRADSIDCAAVRRLAPRPFVIGRSVHNRDEAIAAAAADYLIAGTVWPSASKEVGHRVLGTEGLADIVGSVRVPVLAIGGVTRARVVDVAATGSAGIAAIGLFINSREDPLCRAASVSELIDNLRETFDTFRSGS
jgi:thiamine-phosphate diphosphorylase